MRRVCAAGALSLLLSSCGPGPGPDPDAAVHLFENHSHSLVVWRQAGIRDRIVVHVDGHSDLDRLPDATIERLARTSPEALADSEAHPYALDGETYRRIGIWNFLYPAHRLGVVREVIWVVPDGSLAGAEAARDLVRHTIAEKMHGVSLEEATGFRWDGRALEGRAAGVPLRIVELEDLEAPSERVLLDIDLDFLTTADATSQEVVPAPAISPSALVSRLRAAGIRFDLATVSYSTVGGFLPPAARWVGPAVVRALREPGAVDSSEAARMRLHSALATGSREEAIDLARRVVAESPEDGAARYALSLALAAAGRADESASERARADALDPVLADAELHEGDARWLSGRWQEAEVLYRAYLDRAGDGPWSAYARRRIASCLSRTGRDGEAIDALGAALRAAPDHADSHLELAILLRDRGDFQGALEHLRRAREILPERGTYAMARGTTLALAGRRAEALEELRFAVASRPSWERARATLAALALDSGLRGESVEHASAAVALGSREPITRQLAARLGIGATRP